MSAKAKTLTQSMSWLHTWGGLIFGWLLFAIFLTGTLAVFDREITYWMQPEIQQQPVTQAQAAQTGLDWLAANKPEASRWNLSLPTERSPALRVSEGEGRRGAGQTLNAHTGEELQVRDSAGGGFFFRFHFTLNMPRNLGIWVVGLAAMAMLVALVSGIIIHKKFFKDFFTFRPAKGARSWLDAHNASAVLVLPFHLMITYTGLVIFYLIYMPAAVDALYDGDRQALQRDMRPGIAQQARAEPSSAAELQARSEPSLPARQVQALRQPSGQASAAGNNTGRVGGGRDTNGREGVSRVSTGLPSSQPMLPPEVFIAEGERHFGSGNVSSLTVSQLGLQGATVTVGRVLGSRLALTKGDSLSMDAYSGELLRAPPPDRPSLLTQRVMAGLHFAQFGGYPMRWLYFLCGLASCAMIASGLVLYSVKRRRQYAEHGPVGRALYRLIEGLNVATVAGLSCACIAYLWGNRLLPANLEGRAALEIEVFFAVWLMTLMHGLLRPYMSAWREQLWLAAALCVGLPVLAALTAPQWSWNGLLAGYSIRFWVDMTTAALGCSIAYCAWKVSQPRSQTLRRREPRAAKAPAGALS